MSDLDTTPRPFAGAWAWVLTAVRAHPLTVAVLGGLGVGLLVVLAAGPHGLGVTTDSITYLRSGEDLGRLGAPASAWDEPLAHLGLGLPMLLAGAAIVTGFDVLYAAQVVAVVGCAALGGLAYASCRRLGATAAVGLGAAAVALVGPGVGMAVDISAELPVAVVALLAFVLVGDLTGGPPVDADGRPVPARRSVIPTGLAAGGALLLHPLGLAVGISALVALVVEDRRAGVGGRRAVSFVAVALALPLLWAVRTWLVADSALPSAAGPGRGWSANVLDLVTAAGGWLLPVVSWRPLGLAVGLAVVVVLVLVTRWAWSATPTEARPWARPLALFVPVGAVVLLVSATAGPSEQVGARSVAPLAVALVVLLAPPLARRWRDPSTDSRQRRLAVVVLGLWVALLVVRSTGALLGLAVEGRGLVADRWDHAGLVVATSRLQPTDEVVSDRWDVLLVQNGADVRPAYEPCEPGVDVVVWSDEVTREEVQAELPGYRIGAQLPAAEGVRAWQVDGCTIPGIVDDGVEVDVP